MMPVTFLPDADIPVVAADPLEHDGGDPVTTGEAAGVGASIAVAFGPLPHEVSFSESPTRWLSSGGPLVAALAIVDDETSILYADVVLAALPSSARRSLGELMRTRTYEFQSDFVRRYFYSGKAEGEAKGKAEGEANAVLGVLDARGVDISEEARARILGCTDLDQLDAWIRRAASADSIKDVLD